jgi:hypothetical protein
MSIPHIKELKDDIVDRRYFLRDIHPDQDGNGWRNGTYAQYHGFTFAERIQKPDMIYEPELRNTKRFKPQGEFGDFEFYTRFEKRGFNHTDVLYLIGGKRNCRTIKEVQVYPVYMDDLNSQEQKTGHISVKNETQVAWISESGIKSEERCIARFNMPEWEIEKIGFSHTSISWPHRATIYWREHSTQKNHPVKPAGRLEWKACQLNHSKEARVDKQRCTLSSQNNLIGHLNWGPYILLEQGSYRITAHYSAKTDGAKWDIVVQTNNGPIILADGPMKEANKGILIKDFKIKAELENQPFEFRIEPKDARDIELESITIDPLDAKQKQGSSAESAGGIP